MNVKRTILSVSLGLALTGSVFADTILIKEPEVRTIVTEAGYADPVLVVRDGELWRVKTPDGGSDTEVTVFVNSEGEILGAADVARMRVKETTTTTTTTTTSDAPVEVQIPAEPATPSDVTQIVMNAGFHNVHDIDFLDSQDVWKAEADDISGEDYEIHVDDDTGRIVHIEDD